MNNSIEKFIVSGNVFLWKYLDNIKNYPGWHFTSDNEGSVSLSELLILMNNYEWSCKKTIKVEAPSHSQLQVPNNQRAQARIQFKNTLTFYNKKNESQDFWQIIESKDGLEIQFGKLKAKELQNSIINIPLGYGDFSIADKSEDNILNIWWHR